MAQIVVIKPDARGVFPEAVFEDISIKNDSIVFDLTDGWDYFTYQLIYAGSVTIGSLVNAIQISNDGANPVDFPSGAVTQSTSGFSSLLGVTAVRYVHSTLTTAGTSGKFKVRAFVSRRRTL